MRPIFIGVAGGSGAGKSSLVSALLDHEPDIYGFIELDDYMKASGLVPTHHGRDNWDHPDAIDFDKLVRDLESLRAGNSVTRLTKNRSYNPDYGKTHRKIPIEVRPRPIILVEGFLILHDPRVRSFLDTAIWLEAGHDKRWERRAHFKDDEYETEIHKPMHEQFVQPTRQYAHVVIDAEGKSREQVLSEVKKAIESYITSDLGKFC